jgi:lycopene beta-cyclase
MKLMSDSEPKVEIRLSQPVEAKTSQTVDLKPKKLRLYGAGLAGSLMFFALKKRCPTLEIEVFDPMNKNRPSKTWSFFRNDLNDQFLELLREAPLFEWSHYVVKFPKYSRTLELPYCSLRSEDWYAFLDEKYNFSQKILWPPPKDLEAPDALEPEKKSHKFSPGPEDYFISATGWGPLDPNQKVRWQKFVGLTVKLSAPHQLNGPILMDARVNQKTDYRFMYVLPWSPTEVLIEDTYYSDSFELDLKGLTTEILCYAKNQGFEVSEVLKTEHGQLPLFLTRPAPQKQSHSIRLGAGGQFFHPLTGYTFPFVAMQVDCVSKMISEGASQKEIQRQILKIARRHSFSQYFYRYLNRMLFLGIAGPERYTLLQHFYSKDPVLIQRFYSGKTKLSDMFSILWGRPFPLPPKVGIKYVFES